jgi:hypothetical protein
MSTEMGDESVSHYFGFSVADSLFTRCYVLRYIEDLRLRIESVERLLKQVSRAY